MPVLSTDIKFYPSTSTNSLGGVIDLSGEIPDGTLHAFWDAVSAAEALSGSTEYRCFYVRNENATDTMTTVLAFTEIPPGSVGISVEIGAGSSGLNGQEQTVAQETDAPVGVTFLSAPDAGSGIPLTDLGPNEYHAVWLKRIVLASTVATASDQFTIQILGETV